MLGFGSLVGSSSFGRKKGSGGVNKPANLFFLIVGGGHSGSPGSLNATAPGPGGPLDIRGGGGGGAGGVITNYPGAIQGGASPGSNIVRPQITDVTGTWTVSVGGDATHSFFENNTTATSAETRQQYIAYHGGMGYYPGQGFPVTVGSGGGALGGFDATAKPVFGSTLDNKFNGGAGFPGQGFRGGDGNHSNPSGTGAGGGGAGGAGGDGGPNALANGGAGGAGRAYSITGTPVTYAGGGGGAAGIAPGVNIRGGPGGAGGSSIGGTGGTDAIEAHRPASTINATAGAVNTGSGGGANNRFGSSTGFGGSGVIILSHSNEYDRGVTTGSPTITEVGGNVIYKFTGSGTITW